MYLYYFKRNVKSEIKIEQNEMIQDKISSEILIKKALSHYNKDKYLGFSHIEIKELEIIRDQHGKPYFKNYGMDLCNTTQEIHFSLSHSGFYWACLFFNQPVGLDIETCKRRDKFLKIAERFFTEEEYNYVVNHGEEGFFDLWVRKEAYIKYKGTGLSQGLGSFCLTKKNHRLDTIKDTCPGETCFIHPVEIHPGMKGAYCAGEDKRVENIIEIF